MRVFYDIEISDVTLFYESHSVILDYFNKLKDFIEERLDVLSHEIHAEEVLNELSCTILYVLPGIRNERLEFNYPLDLMFKMKSCFSDDDLTYVAKTLSAG